MPPDFVTFKYIILTVIIVLSLLLNFILVLFIIKECIRLHFFRFKDKLLFSMAVSDILRSIVGYSLEMSLGSLSEENIQRHCNAAAFFISFLSYCSICHLVLMTFDRWLFIAKQRTALRFHASNIQTSFVLMLSWVTSLLLAAFPLLGFGSYGLEENSLRCSINWRNSDLLNRLYQGLVFICCFFIPLFAMIFFYIILRRFIRNSRIAMAGVFEDVTTSAITKARLKAEGRVTAMFFTMAFVFIISWSPYAVLSLMNTFTSSSVTINSIVQSVAVIPAKASTLYNPVVIAYYDQSFRQFLLRFVKCNKSFCRINDRIVPLDRVTEETPKENAVQRPVEIDV